MHICNSYCTVIPSTSLAFITEKNINIKIKIRVGSNLIKNKTQQNNVLLSHYEGINHVCVAYFWEIIISIFLIFLWS